MARISSLVILATVLSFMGMLSAGATAVALPTPHLDERSVAEESAKVLEARQRQRRPWDPFSKCPCNYWRQGDECRPMRPPNCGPGYVWDFESDRCEVIWRRQDVDGSSEHAKRGELEARNPQHDRDHGHGDGHHHDDGWDWDHGHDHHHHNDDDWRH